MPDDPQAPDTFRELSGGLLHDGYAVRFRAAGTSMEPAIRDGDWITVARVSPGEIRQGDVVFYACGRRTIAHRVIEVRSPASPEPTFIVRGDAKGGSDAPVAASQVLGKVIAVERAAASCWLAAKRALHALFSGVTPREGRG